VNIAMDCTKAQPLFDDLSRNRLDPETAAQVRQHLTDCTDCRVLEQRAARLQRLLALKRYERPASECLENFLPEFHARLRAETRQTARWERALEHIDNLLVAGTMRVWRYGLASSLGVAVVVAVTWMSVRQTDVPDNAADQTASANSSLVLAESAAELRPAHPVSHDFVTPIPVSLQAASVDDQSETAGSEGQVPAPTHADYAVPRYVLDRIIPASYEVASRDF
jgi:predicted anti-sigma-YlaC factor YlaD